MIYVLLLLTLMDGNWEVINIKSFDSMDKCFDTRELIIKVYKRPIVNYQAVCVLEKKNAKN